MRICYRDEIGTVTVSVDPDYPITFNGGFAYFTDAAGRDYKIPVTDIFMIGQEA